MDCAFPKRDRGQRTADRRFLAVRRLPSAVLTADSIALDVQLTDLNLNTTESSK